MPRQYMVNPQGEKRWYHQWNPQVEQEAEGYSWYGNMRLSKACACDFGLNSLFYMGRFSGIRMRIKSLMSRDLASSSKRSTGCYWKTRRNDWRKALSVAQVLNSRGLCWVCVGRSELHIAR
jgi:hypothetical protein